MARLAITLNTSWSIYNHRLGLLRALEKEGFEIHAIAPFDAYSEKIPYPLHHWRLKQRGQNPINEFYSYWHLRQIYKKIKPDVVLHYTIKPNIYGTFAAESLHIPSICNVSGLGYSFQKDSSFFKSLIAKLYLKALSKTDFIFFQNHQDYDFFLQMRPNLKKKSDILPGSGVDIDRFKPFEKDVHKEVTFLMASRLFKEKGVIEYIQAAIQIRAKYPNTRFILIGDVYQGSSKIVTYEVLHFHAQRGDIEYFGLQEDVYAFMKMADCVVLPTYYHEGCPRVLIEAASCGLPIIATNNVGCTDIVVDDFNGYLCEKQSVESLFEKMEKFLLIDNVERKRLGNNGRKKVVDEFDEQIIIKKYIDNIKTLLS